MANTLSPAERRRDERRLLEYIENPSPRLLTELVERYQPLARSLAMRYRGVSEPMEDLMQVAELGLVAAIKGFDPSRGKPFTAYAVPTILGEIKHHFRDRVWNLRLPRSLQEATATVDRATERLTGELGRAPSPVEIAERTELSERAVREALSAAEVRYTVSYDAPAGGADDETTAGDRIGGIDPGYDRVEAELASRSANLDEREARVLRMRFNEGMTQREIGKHLGVSQMQVSRISRGGLKKLIGAVQGREPLGMREVA
jgi:RNA polymerase sigma-B factor